MKNLLIISLLLLVWSCSTQKKAEKFFAEHPEKFADKCASTFPVKDSSIVKDSISFDTLYIEQPGQVLKDSFYIKGDTIVRVVEKKCPAAATLIKTIRHDSIIYRRNTAYEAALLYRINDLQKLVSDYLQTIQDKNKELHKDQDTIKTKNKWLIWLIIIIATQTLYIVRKPLFALLKL